MAAWFEVLTTDDAFLQDRCSPLLFVIMNQKSPL